MTNDKEQLLSRLERCIREDGFTFMCQPIYSEDAGRYTAAELLLRMDGGADPSVFIPLAEVEGLSGELDLLVLRHALELLERLGSPPGFDYLSVNLSPLTLETPEWAGAVLHLLQTHRALCPRLCIELTETALAPDLDKVGPAMELLSALDCTLAIDDFGSGQSTIERCMALPFHMVKLDKSLTDRVLNNRAAPVFRELLCMLKRMKWDVVAEGVESERQYEALLGYGCRRFQGYYFSRPMPEAAWLSAQRVEQREVGCGV